MQDQSSVLIYIDEESKPIGAYKTPINFELDTTKLVDGEHTLKIVSKSNLGKEGIRKTPHSIPAWLWVVIILFVGWAMYYLIISLNMQL